MPWRVEEKNRDSIFSSITSPDNAILYYFCFCEHIPTTLSKRCMIEGYYFVNNFLYADEATANALLQGRHEAAATVLTGTPTNFPRRPVASPASRSLERYIF
jgi:hypothetical protein